VAMPLRYEQAFGGIDRTHPNANRHDADLRNPVGVGFHRNSDTSAIINTPLPNLEDPRAAIVSWSDKPEPIGFGVIGRGWKPRIAFAGTYNETWMKDRFPFLPADFDDQYFLSAAADQQVAFLKGGQAIRCINMAPRGIVSFLIPKIDLPITFRFDNRRVELEPNLDTLIVEPDKYRFVAIWRATVPLGRKLRALREVLVGEAPWASYPRRRNGKPFFRSLSELVEWRRALRR
jgi:hypothetical protein